MTEDGEEEDEEDEDEEEELGAGYLLWFCLFLVDATPLLQLGLSAPRSQGWSEKEGQLAIKQSPGDYHRGPFPFPPIQQPALSPEQGRTRGVAFLFHSPHQLFPEPSGVWLTCVVHVGTTGTVSGAEAGGARIAVLGLGASGAQAADLTVGAIHHLHKLSAPVEGAERRCSGPGPGCGFLPPAEGLGSGADGPDLLEHEEQVGVVFQ